MVSAQVLWITKPPANINALILITNAFSFMAEVQPASRLEFFRCDVFSGLRRGAN
jgi:hypothetical protein